jgi:phage FluMu protein Com
MKITIPMKAPRAKWLNDILLSKRSERHNSAVQNSSRAKQKDAAKKEIDDQSK